MPPDPPSLPHALHTDTYLSLPIIHTISFCTHPPLDKKLKKTLPGLPLTCGRKETNHDLISCFCLGSEHTHTDTHDQEVLASQGIPTYFSLWNCYWLLSLPGSILTGSIENGIDFVIQMMSLATYLHACTYIVDVCVGGGGDEEKMS